MSARTVLMVVTYTDAPPRYDGFGTRTRKVLGFLRGPLGARAVREVETPQEHLSWQRGRYQSGMYLSADEEQLPRVRSLFLPLQGSCPFCGESMAPPEHTCLEPVEAESP